MSSNGTLYLYFSDNGILHSQFFDGKGVGLGSNCSSEAHCAHILHAECKDSVCACASEYYRDKASGEVCIAGKTFQIQEFKPRELLVNLPSVFLDSIEKEFLEHRTDYKRHSISSVLS